MTVAGTGEVSGEAVTFRFETAAAGTTAAARLVFQDDLIDAAPGTRPTIGFWQYLDGDAPPPKKVGIEVFRLADMDAAIESFRDLRSWGWARRSSTGLTPTDGLRRVLAADLPLEDYQGAPWTSLPDDLPAGWYLLQLDVPGRSAQAVLQVTNVAAYLAVSDTRTVVWANDLATKTAIAAATARADAVEIGRTGADGLLLAATPAVLLPTDDDDCPDPCLPVVTVTTADGRAAFMPATGSRDPDGFFDGFYDGFSFSNRDDRYWLLFEADRTLFRRTDSINLWGVVRERDSGAVPTDVEMRLMAVSDDRANTVLPIVASELSPGPTGAFAGTLALASAPEGWYDAQLVVGGDVVTSRRIQVGQILKPAYRLEVETGRRVYLVGDRIRVTARAAFYDGSPVPNVPIRMDGYLADDLTTDESGTVVIRTTARVDEDGGTSGPSYQSIQVTPGRPEEGEIAAASREFIVFPSTRTISADAEISKGRVRVSGAVHLVDQEGLEIELAGGGSVWELDPRGDAVAGATVSVRFVERVVMRSASGTEYDFIQKKVVTTYDYRVSERTAGSMSVRTDAKGAFSASISEAAGFGDDSDYEVVVSVRDGDGNRASASAFASSIVWGEHERSGTTLGPTTPSGDDPKYGVGDTVDLTLHDPAAVGTRGSFLFFEAQRGIRSAVVQAEARFVTTFAEWAAPGFDIRGVRFTGSGYSASASYRAPFRVADRSLTVQLSTPSSRHAPGDDVTVDVRTLDAGGTPTAATVVLRAIDEKLYTIFGADSVASLQGLYVPVGDGIRATWRTHRSPRGNTEGGDTTGGGGDDRVDFRDSLLFTTITTGADGRGSVDFSLSDDLTSWRVTASAITTDLQAGDGTLQIPVGLPFFVDASIAPEYLVADRPAILVRTFGTGLTTGDDVSISVESTSLGLKVGPLAANAFETVAVPLPALRPGIHEITIRATSGIVSSAMSDGLTRTFLVVESRLARTRTDYIEVGAQARVKGGEGLTSVVVADAGAGRHVPLLLGLAGGGGARLDSSLAAAVAASLLTGRLGVPADTLPTPDFVGGRYQTPDGGLALLPYAGSNLELSALAALTAPDRFDRRRLESYLSSIATRGDETRERQIHALAGLAGLGAAVLPELRAAAADPALTIRERLLVGLGAAAIGDVATARAMLDGLVREYGETTDGRTRLRVGSAAVDIATATALGAVLAASVGDVRAPALWAYVEANPSREAIFDLHAVAYAGATLDWLVPQAARFAWTVAGERTVVELTPGEAYGFSVTSEQLASLRIERLDGAIGVTTAWREPVSATAFQPDPDVTIKRTITPSGRIGASDLVRVDLVVRFGPQAPTGCHPVTDLVPSGLVAVGRVSAWANPEEEQQLPDASLPYGQAGQRVSWCAEPSDRDRTVELRYYARVITPGTYAWQPAIVESRTDPDRAALAPAVQVEIR